MERGPWALFWAIVAVGLGPAMWLGVQFGEITEAPQRAPAVTVQPKEVSQPLDATLGGAATAPVGGEGAGVVGDDPTADVTDEVPERAPTEPPRDTRPVKIKPSPSASESSSASPSASASASTSESASVPPSEESSTGPSTPAYGSDDTLTSGR